MMRHALLASVFLASLALGPSARAQVESREGITLQNQILQLRQELEQLRARGGGGYAAPALPPPSRGGAAGGGSELVGQLLDRVSALEDETKRLRGRVDQLEFQNRNLQQQMEKLQGDTDYRLQQVEQGGGAARRPQAPATPAPAAPPASAPPAGAPPAAAPRTPERALSDGQAALSRRDYAVAEAAAREVIGARSAPRQQDAQILLGDALLGRRDYQNAALAYDDAYRRNRKSGRAPEALLGLANAFTGFGAKREACQTLDQLNSEFPKPPGGLASQAAQARQRAGCR
jgi:TolA-binding protein